MRECGSSGVVGIRFATVQAPVFMVLFWRSFLTGLVLLPFALTKRPHLTHNIVAEQTVFGVLGMFAYLAGLALAIGARVPTGLAALVAADALRNGRIGPPASLVFAFGIVWLVVLEKFGGYAVYDLCLRFRAPARVSSVLLLSPPVTMIWAWAMFGEPVSQFLVLGLAIALFGAWLSSARH